MGIYGITKIVQGVNIIEPAMGQESWFELSTQKTELIFFGSALSFFGFVIVCLIGSIVTHFSTRSPEDEADSVHRQVMKEKRYRDRLKENGTLRTAREINLTDEDLGLDDMRQKNVRYCPYCGTEMEANERICPSCNARIRK